MSPTPLCSPLEAPSCYGREQGWPAAPREAREGEGTMSATIAQGDG